MPMPIDIRPNAPETGAPEVLWVRPSQLRVDPAYQRDLSRKSADLIARIVADFDWRRFKPPVVIRTADPETFDIIDGQHTAIAAETHGGIDRIPVLLIDAQAVQDKAKAFLGHNRDRVAMSSTQLFWAAVAAGDEDALTVKQVCDRAGARILRLPPSKGQFRIGDTMAVSVLKRLCASRGAMKARVVVETCVKANAAPVGADMLRAVDEILSGRDYAGEIEAANLTTALMRLDEWQAKIVELATAKSLPAWRAMVIVLYQNTRKTRKPSHA